MPTDKKIFPYHPRINTKYRLILACVAFVLFGMVFLNPLHGQDNPGSKKNPLPVDAWTDEMIGPPFIPEQGEIITAVIPVEARTHPPVQIYSDTTQRIPVVQVKGEYFDPSGLCSSLPLSANSNQAVRLRMKKAVDMGFGCFMLRVDWPSLEPENNRLDITRVQDLLQYADDIGLKVIISLELDRAPRWFLRGEAGSSRVMVSYLVDPEMETRQGNDGDLRWADGSGIPIIYHPDTINATKRMIYGLCNTLCKEPALLGWYVNGPVTMSFPGGGREGVVGMADYSPFTVTNYSSVTGSLLMTYPLARYSTGSWDRRDEFRQFLNYRLVWKREAFDEVIDALAEADTRHLLFVGMDPVLNYRSDNGYLSMIMLPDSTRQFLHKGVDGAVIAFRLSSKTFDPLNPRSETSAIHLNLTLNQVIRNGRIAVVLIEKDLIDPPSISEIENIAQMIKAAGGYPVWASGFIQERGNPWSWPELNAIERTQPLSLLPPPKRLRRGQVAIFDLPLFYSSFYADQNATLSLALIQLAIHQRTGVVMEVVSADELPGGNPVLQQYNNLIYLTPELLTTDAAKAWCDTPTQISLYGYSLDSRGIIEAVDPMLLHQYVLENYHSINLEDQLRTRYVHRGATADLLNGADAIVVANDPYVFIYVKDTRGTNFLDVKLAGWPISTMEQASFVNTDNGDPVTVRLTSGTAGFHYNHTSDETSLFVQRDDYQKVKMPLENRKIGVTISQQSENMRRSVPAALLLAALLAVTLVWMTFQSQQRSLLQAAELVDRRRRMEPIDILDEPEVMEFYKTYISGEKNQSVEKPPDNPNMK